MSTTIIRRMAFLAVVPVLGLAAACGGGDGKADDGIASAGGGSASSAPAARTGDTAAQSKGRFYDAQLKYVQCMRQNGLPEWPDPKLSGFPDMAKVEALQARLQAGSNLRAGQEKLGRAMRACMPQFRAVEQLTPRVDQRKAYEAMLRHAKCMRKNGVPGFTNPSLQDGRAVPGGEQNPAKPKIDQEGPAYRRAVEACRPTLPEGVYQ